MPMGGGGMLGEPDEGLTCVSIATDAERRTHTNRGIHFFDYAQAEVHPARAAAAVAVGTTIFL